MSRVLVAEDQPDTSWMHRIILEHRGHTVAVAGDGIECLRIYNEALNEPNKELPSHDPFDIVILDCRMPRMTGAEVANEILSMNKKQRIAFAAAYIGASKRALLNNPRIEILSKPFEPKELIKLVENNVTITHSVL